MFFFETILKKNSRVFFLVFFLIFAPALRSGSTDELLEEKEIAALDEASLEELETPEQETTEDANQEYLEEEVTENAGITPEQTSVFATKQLQLPIFGKIVLEALVDPETGEPRLVGHPAQTTFDLGIIKITNPTFQYDAVYGISLSSEISLNIPQVAPVATKLSATFNMQTIGDFTGSIDIPIAFQDNIVLQNVQIFVSTTTGYVELSGELNLLFMAGDVKIIDSTILAKLAINKVNGKPKVTFSGELQTPEPLRPFALIPGINQIKDIRDIAISDISVSLDSHGAFLFTGSCTILGITTTANIIKTPGGITVKAWPSGAIDVSTVIPGLKGSPLEKLDFSGFILAISSVDYNDPELKLALPRGMSFIIRSKLEAGPLAGVAKLVGPQSLNIVGTFGTSLEDLALSVAAPAIIRIPDPKDPLKSIASLENLVLSIKGKGPTIAGKVRIKAQLPMSKQDAIFSGELGMELSDPISINAKGSMVGIWNDVLGIKGLALGDLGFELGLGYSSTLATTLASALGAVTMGAGAAAQPLLGFYPSRIAYTGYLGIGSRSIRLATKLTDNLDVVLLGDFKGALATKDLVELATKLGAKIPIDRLIDLEVRDSTFKVAFGETSIGDIKFSPGVTIKGQLIIKGAGGVDFPDQAALVDISVGFEGITAAGSLPRFKLGNFLEITGAGMDQKWGTADDGPAFKLALTPSEQIIYLSGQTVLLGNRSKIDINVSPRKAYFYSQQKLQGLFEIEWKGESVGSGNNLDFKIEGNMKNEVQFTFSKEDLQHSMATLEKERVKAVKKRDTELAAIDKKIAVRDAKLKEINPVYRKVVQEFEKGSKRIEKQEKEVLKMNAEIKKLQKSLGLTASTTPLPTKKEAHPKSLVAETGESIKSNIEKGAKNFQKGAHQFFSILLNPTKWAPTARLNGLITARNIAMTALGVSKFANERVKESLQMLDPEIGSLFRMRSAIWFKHLPELARWEAAKIFVQNAINSYPAIKWLTPVAVKKLKLNASLRHLLPPHFGLPDVECTINAFGIENTIVIKKANITNLPNLIKDLAISFVKQFQENVLGTKTQTPPPDLPILENLKKREKQKPQKT